MQPNPQFLERVSKLSSFGRMAVLFVVTIGCHEDGPCSSESCDRPTPYCDVDGRFGGTPGVCVEVECTQTTFAGCRGTTAITCNASGGNYVDTSCPLGCDEVAQGCRTCEPDQQACADGT